MRFQVPDGSSTLVNWNDLSSRSGVHAALGQRLAFTPRTYEEFVQGALVAGGFLRLPSAPSSIRASTLPAADLGEDPVMGHRELYILGGRAYLECIPSHPEGPSHWYDLGQAPH